MNTNHTSENPGAITMLYSLKGGLEKNGEKIKELESLINFFQNTLNKPLYKNDPKFKEKNRILSWYNFFHESYKADNFKLNTNKQKLVNEFKKDDYYILKNIVEIVGRQIISSSIRKEGNEDLNIRTIMSSDSDDTFNGVDLILTMKDNNGKESYLGIDVATTDDEEYLKEKKKKQYTQCTEFNLYKGINPNTKIKRSVLAFEKKVMANLLLELMSQIKDGKEGNIVKLYEKIHKEKHDKYISHEKLTVDSIKNDTNNILSI